MEAGAGSSRDERDKKAYGHDVRGRLMSRVADEKTVKQTQEAGNGARM